MIIDCIADLHGHYPKLEGGDFLIVAGDLTARDTQDQFDEFFSWLSIQDYKRSVVIGGNHDNLLQKGCIPFLELDKPEDISIDYLCDSGTEFEGLKIWGSPWTKRFKGMNPHCMAFTVDTDEKLAEKWAMIPDDIDILVTHSPPYEIFDEVLSNNPDEIENVGSLSLRDMVFSLKNIKLSVFGHVHEGYGWGKLFKSSYSSAQNDTLYVNASHVNERYQPVNKPIRIIL